MVEQGRRGWRLVRARRDAVPSSVRRFTARARRRRLRAAAPWLALLAVLGLTGLVLAVVYRTPLFGVDTVTVRGTHYADPAAVRAAARVTPGTPLAAVDGATVARRVGAVAAVRSASIDRRFPDELVITVVERTPVAAVPHGDAYALVDGDGVVVTTVTGARPPDLPVVRVTSPGRGDPATVAALTVLAALPPVLRDPLVEVVAESNTRVRLVLTDGRTVFWGDATDNAAKAQVAEVLLRQKRRTMDVSAPGAVTVK